ncbi:MAG: hypothetical protein COB16_16910 [Rhodobacteraceae bacterium]|nr:MAG: hypothetical protein COB16_16910 [Paracoccaceae bacterium]
MTSTVIALSLPILLLVFATLRNIRRGINLGDEGYLVYGTQAVLRGEVPIRDFRGYDPARYYWCALWFRLIGPGFITVRIAMTVVSLGSIFLIVLLVEHATENALLASVTACLSLIWMRPIHKQIEVFFSIVCCAVMYALLSGVGYPPLLGALGGVAAAFGLNIAIYFGASAVLVLLAGSLANSEHLLSAAPQFALGFLAACLGLILAAAITPRFLGCYLDKKVFAILRRGASNLALPKPWLWATDVPQLKRYGNVKRFVLRFIFTLLPVVYVAAIGGNVRALGLLDTSATNLVLASACTGLVYFHHVLSRADLSHLYQVFHPFVIFAAASSQVVFGVYGAVAVVVILFGSSVLLLFREHIFIFGPLAKHPTETLFEIGSDKFLLTQHDADQLQKIHDIICSHSTSSDRILSVPNIPGFLALLNRGTAVYDTFPVYPASQQARDTMLKQIIHSDPPVAIISRAKVDGRDDLMFANNYPEVEAFIKNNYTSVFKGRSETIFIKRCKIGSLKLEEPIPHP